MAQAGAFVRTEAALKDVDALAVVSLAQELQSLFARWLDRSWHPVRLFVEFHSDGGRHVSREISHISLQFFGGCRIPREKRQSIVRKNNIARQVPRDHRLPIRRHQCSHVEPFNLYDRDFGVTLLRPTLDVAMIISIARALKPDRFVAT